MSRNSGKKSKGKSSVSSKMSNKQLVQFQQPRLSFSQQLLSDVLADTEYQQQTNRAQMQEEANLNAGLLQCIIHDDANGINDLIKAVKQMDEQKLEENIGNFIESKCDRLASIIIQSINLEAQISSYRNLQKLRILDALVKTQKKNLAKESIALIYNTVQKSEQSNIPVQKALRVRGKIQLLC